VCVYVCVCLDLLAAHRYEDVYNGYMNWMQNITALKPYMVLPGNHEAECKSELCLNMTAQYGLPLSNFSAYNARFRMPAEESGEIGVLL
jgi:hypothetical protein